MDLFNDLPMPKNEYNHSNINEATNQNENKETTLNLKRTNDEDGVKHNENENSKKFCSSELIKIKAYVAERKGERDEMQDKHVIIENFLPLLPKDVSTEIKRVSYYAVFDGHSGVRASEFCANRMHKILAEKFPKGSLEQIEKDIKKCLVETFKQVDEEFLKIASKTKPAWKDGTTATVLILINDILYVANIGDSKAVIYRTNENGDNIPIVLTKDHNPTMYEERQRIQKAGGNIRDGRVLGVLEVSRSIGDGQFKAYGVTSFPDLRKCQLNANFRYVVLACDGLWKSFKNEEVAEFLRNIQNSNDKTVPENKSKEDYLNETSCNRLANEAVKKLSADNVTVMYLPIFY